MKRGSGCQRDAGCDEGDVFEGWAAGSRARSMTRVLRPGWASMRGLKWLARVGPSPLDPWRYAMGWSEVAARNHARRLEREGWLERCPMVRGEGSLFFATRKGVMVLGVPLIGCTTPAPTWWAHDSGCAWTAAWLSVRGRKFLGPRNSSTVPSGRGSSTGSTATTSSEPDIVPTSSSKGRRSGSPSRSSSQRNRNRGWTQSSSSICTGSSAARRRRCVHLRRRAGAPADRAGGPAGRPLRQQQ